MSEAYTGFRPEDIHHGFIERQKKSAEAIFRDLLPFLQRGEIRTIVDLGCGSGEILAGLYGHIGAALRQGLIDPEVFAAGSTVDGAETPAQSSCVRLVGLDSSPTQIENAKSATCMHSDNPSLSLTFRECDPNQVISEQFSDHGINDLQQTAVICISHTIFHLTYLAKLFDSLARNPAARPLLWLVDIFRTWDAALKYLDQKPAGDFLEPIGFRERDGRQIVDTLFTRRADDDFVERGLMEIFFRGDRNDIAVTRQLRWTSCDLRDQFFRCGYSLRREVISMRGWGEMTTHLFRIPPKRITVSDIFMASRETTYMEAQNVKKRRSAEFFKRVPSHSPIPPITDWIRQSNVIAPEPGLRRESLVQNIEGIDEGTFDFVLVEYAPWHDVWTGQKRLHQEISLISRSGVFSSSQGDLISRYNGTARAFQNSDLGMFLHPYLTDDTEEEWGAITSSFHLSTRTEKVRARLSGGPQPVTIAPADGANSFHSPPQWRADQLRVLQSRYETIPSDERQSSDPSPPGTTYVPTGYPHFGLNERIERSKLAEGIARRIERDHSVSCDESIRWRQACRDDYEWTVELFHVFIRNKFGLDTPNNPMRTFVISAPLRLNREKTGAYEPRGGIWIFAGTRSNYGSGLSGTLRTLLRKCLLVGGLAVESSANRSARDGLSHYAAQAASAAIMSRNMSHNIGSHPLAALTTKQQVEKDAGTARTADFLGYIRSRMDYIASICTDVPRWALTADLREVLTEFTAKTDEEKPPWLLDKLTELEIKPNIIWGSDDDACPFLLPHGVIGKHALFSIFENALRNSEKHGMPSSPERGQARMRVDATDPNFVTVTLIDHGSLADPGLIEDLKEKLEEPFYGSGGEHEKDLNRKFWGLKEMRISAAYLRMRAGQNAESYDDRDLTAVCAAGKPWIEPVIELCENGQKYLGWRFLLLKPRVAMVIADDTGLSPQTRSICEKYGIAVSSFEDLKQRLAQGENLLHSFLVMSAACWKKSESELAGLSNGLPLRRIVVGSASKSAAVGWAWCDRLDFDSPAALEEQLYEAWNRMLYTNAGAWAPPLLVLATKVSNEKVKGEEKTAMPRLDETGRLIAKQKSVSTTDDALTALLKDSQIADRRLVLFERHADEEGGIYHYRPGCCFKTVSCAHDIFWARAQAFLGVKFATPEFQQVTDAEKDGVAAQRLIEAAFVQVVVIDDREAIQRLVDSELNQKKFAFAGTTILKFASPSNISQDEIAAQYLAQCVKALQRRFRQARPGMVIVTIHQTILDKLKKTIKPVDWIDSIERDLPEFLKEHDDRTVPVVVVIHSGRGRPGEMYTELRGRRFLEFSNVQSLLDSPGQKALLTEVLLAVRA